MYMIYSDIHLVSYTFLPIPQSSYLKVERRTEKEEEKSIKGRSCKLTLRENLRMVDMSLKAIH